MKAATIEKNYIEKQKLEAWNRDVKPGQSVLYFPVAGVSIGVPAVVESEAFLLLSGEPVVFLKGKSGVVSIDNVFKVNET